MTNQQLHAQKYQAQLDEWKADIAKFKAKAIGAKADAQIEMNKLIADLENKVDAANGKLAEFSAAGEDAWENVKKNVESTWDNLKTSVHDAAAKLKA